MPPDDRARPAVRLRVPLERLDRAWDDRGALLHRDHHSAELDLAGIAELLPRPFDVDADGVTLADEPPRLTQRLAVGQPSLDRKCARPDQQLADDRHVEQLLLGHVVDRARREDPDQRMVERREVVGGDDESPLERDAVEPVAVRAPERDGPESRRPRRAERVGPEEFRCLPSTAWGCRDRSAARRHPKGWTARSALRIEERARPAAYGEAWRSALRAFSVRCAASASAASTCSAASRPSCRSRSRSTPRPGRPSLYEYRPLVRKFVEARAERLAASDDARIAIDELRREPAAAIFARAHAGVKPTEEEALLRTVLLPLLVKTAEACGGFDWDDGAFDHAYAEFERSLFGERRAYAAVTPVIGISAPVQLDLGRGIRLRPAADGRARGAVAGGARPAPSRFRPRCRPALRARARAGARRRARSSRRTRRARSATSSRRSGSRRRRRSPPAPSCSSGSTGGRSASGRCCRSPRRSRSASRPGWTRSARASRPTSIERLGAADADPRARRGARPLGAVSLPGRAVPLRAAARVAVRAARWHRRIVGGRASRLPSSRREPPRASRGDEPAEQSRPRGARGRGGRRSAAACARRGPDARRPRYGWSRRWTKPRSASVRGRRATSPRARSRVRRSDLRHRFRRYGRPHGRKRTRPRAARTGSNASSRKRRLRRSLLDEVRALLGEAEAWVRSEARANERAEAAVEALRGAPSRPAKKPFWQPKGLW